MFGLGIRQNSDECNSHNVANILVRGCAYQFSVPLKEGTGKITVYWSLASCHISMLSLASIFSPSKIQGYNMATVRCFSVRQKYLLLC